MSLTYAVIPRTFLVHDSSSIAIAMGKESKKLIVLLILGSILHQHQVNAFADKALRLASFAWDTFGVINTAHDTYSKFDSPSISDVLDETDKIFESLDKQGAKIEEKLQSSVEMLLTRLPLMAEIAGDIRLLNTYIVRIDELYGDLTTFVEFPDYFDDSGTRFLTKAWISRDGDDVQGTIARMFSLIVPQRLGKFKKSLFVSLAQESRGNDINVCDTGAPPQQRLLELFDIAIESEMRAFAMYGFGLLIEGYLDKDNYTVDVERAGEKLQTRSKEYLKIFRSTVTVAGRLFRRCDPFGGHEQGVTYYEFKKFLQSIVVQESIFQQDHRCPKSCGGYDDPSYPNFGCEGIGCGTDINLCWGRLTKCQSMNWKAVICGASGSRRYEWFQDNDGNSFGDESLNCPQKIQSALRVGNCDVCRCVCVEDHQSSSSSHTISLRKQLANVEDNMIVTGLAFVIVNEIAHVRIMQARLGPRARVLKNSTSWVEPEDIEYDMAVHKFILKTEDWDYEDLIEDKDIAVLTLENRRINLDTLNVPIGHVLTGVRFSRVMEDKDRRIQLEIHATSFNAVTGKLDLDSSHWLTPKDMPYAQEYLNNVRTEHVVEGFRNPLKATQTNIDSKPYTFIEFDWSSFKYDAAQTTIPLLDGLPLVSDPPAPIVGIGLYHKAKPGYGGFLTFVLEGIDQSIYVSMDP